MAENQWRTWGVEYGYEGRRYELHVVARTADEAMARVRSAAAFGTCDGYIVATIPAVAGGALLAPLVTWWLNWRHAPRSK